MPLNPPPSAVENLPRGILLVEEYGALGVAISSALRKFAPLYGVEVAHNFAEAEITAAKMRPELFVLDLDPPPCGEIEFLNKLKANYPETRVLVIAAGMPGELRAARGTAGAIQFIGKPFDLAEFGAAIQALLGRWAVPPASALRGTLRDLHVIDIVEVKCLAGSTAVVRIDAAGDTSGEIHFRKGQISHAITGTLSGLPALEEIVRWPGARLSEAELAAASPRTIDANWQSILLQLVRNVNEQSRQNLLATNPPPQPAVKTGKKILVIDDTEMLLIFAADVLATADQNFQILTAASGAEGLRLAASERPDLVLLDYCLTDMSGDKVCRALLENPLTARIAVLMMSGHLSELAKTAEDYENVIAALPKPFLSGALINAVEKALAAGPLPKRSKPNPIPSTPAPSSPAPKLERSAPLSSNGDSAKIRTAAPPSPPAHKEPEIAKLDRPPIPRSISPPMIHPTSSTQAAVVRPTELKVTLALNVVAMEFTSAFQVETATLQPFDPIVAIHLGGEKESSGTALESGFRLSEISLRDNCQIETMRVVPTREPPRLPFPSRLFPVGASRLERANPDSKLQLTAAAGTAMRVWLTAQFDLLAVELSADFEVTAVVLKARSTPVFMHNHGAGSGRSFEVVEVQLDSTTELTGLLVRLCASDHSLATDAVTQHDSARLRHPN